MHTDAPREEKTTTRHRDRVDAPVCRLYLLCRRALAGDADAVASLAPYLPPPPSGAGGDTRDAVVYPARLARCYRHYWTALTGDADAAAAIARAAASWPPTLADAREAYARTGLPAGARDMDIAAVVEAVGRCTREASASVAIASAVDGPAPRRGPDDRAWTYHVMVGHGRDENDVVLFGLDREGDVRYETGYYVIPHGQEPDPIGGRSAGQRIGRAGRRRMPTTIGACASALPSLLQAVAAESPADALVRLCRHPPPESLPSDSDAVHETDAAQPTRRRRPIADPPRDVDHKDVDTRQSADDDGGRSPSVLLGAVILQRALAPLRRVADLPTAIVTYMSENDPDADRMWLGGRPVSTARIDSRRLETALRLYAGHMAARRAVWLFEHPPSLAAAAARICAIAAVPLDRQRAPAEALALVGAHVWYLVCSARPLAGGRLPQAARLVEAARALGVTPTGAEMALPELLCETLAGPALSCAALYDDTRSP